MGNGGSEQVDSLPMTRALGLTITALALLAMSACSVLVGTSGLTGGAVEAQGDAATDGARGADATTGPLPSSCKELHARSPDAGSGPYPLGGDGGAVNADCDMESFGGGWTRVTPSMIVEAKTVQEYAPQSPAHVEVATGTDARGGVFYALQVTADNCGQNQGGGGPGHYFLVRELDHWTQIMASYEFTSTSPCWNIFGDPGGRSTNVFPFDVTKDLIGPQVNMSRSAAGASIPYDGRTTACDENANNFWNGSYASDPKSARVVLRRFAQSEVAGLAVVTDCGPAGWKVSDIFVR
jgi:hypothetical protein